jgi:hypothetical protein
MPQLEFTPYFDEFLRYYALAKEQHFRCNLGLIPHENLILDDDLMQNVYLYDVVHRRCAGFTQIILDMWYGDTPEHPYHKKMHEIRKPIARGKMYKWDLETWLYIFILHRVTGSAIDYGKNPSGYWNTILPELQQFRNIEEMTQYIAHRSSKKPFYTSVGYQFPAFPKPPTNWKRGGDHYLCSYAPLLAKDLAYWLSGKSIKKTLRETGQFMLDWNVKNGLRQYHFQYSAVVADIADFYPELVKTDSLFFYGKNAIECISYMAHKPRGMKRLEFLDTVMETFHEKTGSKPYDAEDVACDFIRWVESYIRPGASYDHLDRDKIFSSHRLPDHPFGRQKRHLELGLIPSFNKLKVHPADDYVIKQAGITAQQYREMVKANAPQ